MTGFQSKKAMVRSSHPAPPNPNNRTLPHFKIVDSGLVDEEMWYTVNVYRHECAKWIRNNKKEWQYEHAHNMRGNLFDIHGKLYTIMALTWSS